MGHSQPRSNSRSLDWSQPKIIFACGHLHPLYMRTSLDSPLTCPWRGLVVRFHKPISVVSGIDLRGRPIAPVVLVRYSEEMPWLVSILILVTLTCPVMCRDDVGCCGESDGGLTRTESPVCCPHCLQHHSEGAPEEGTPPQPSRPCTCSCLCGGAVLVDAVSVPELPVLWFVMDLWAPITPESVSTGTMRGDSYLYERCPITGYELRIVECSLRS